MTLVRWPCSLPLRDSTATRTRSATLKECLRFAWTPVLSETISLEPPVGFVAACGSGRQRCLYARAALVILARCEPALSAITGADSWRPYGTLPKWVIHSCAFGKRCSCSQIHPHVASPVGVAPTPFTVET